MLNKIGSYFFKYFFFSSNFYRFSLNSYYSCNSFKFSCFKFSISFSFCFMISFNPCCKNSYNPELSFHLSKLTLLLVKSMWLLIFSFILFISSSTKSTSYFSLYFRPFVSSFNLYFRYCFFLSNSRSFIYFFSTFSFSSLCFYKISYSSYF